MDFGFTEDQQALQALAARILADGAGPDRQRALEQSGAPRFDRALWTEMARAGLIGVAVGSDAGGAGLGVVDLALVLQEVGRRTAPIPLWETAALGGLAIDRFGSAAQRAAWLPPLAAGETVWTAVLPPRGGDPAGRPIRAARDGSGWRIDGSATCVPGAAVADRALVAAEADAGPLVLAVDLREGGVERVPVAMTSGDPDARLGFAGVRVGDDAVLGRPGDGARIADWIGERADAGIAALTLGLCEEALRLTAAYIKERRQFGQPIAMFQAVAHRAADAYIDTEAIRLTAWQAASRLAAGEPAPCEVAVAKYWAAEAGHRVVHAAQHLHGGIGVDRDYPLHRYFLLARRLLLLLGGPTAQLLRIGAALADHPAE